MATFGDRMRSSQSNSQAGSLAAKLGFQDPDRKDPKHDEIVLWLDGKLREENFRVQFLDSVSALQMTAGYGFVEYPSGNITHPKDR